MSEETGFQHQCRRPPVWWALVIGSRYGREWVCPKCGETWMLGYMRFPAGLPGAPLIYEWQVVRTRQITITADISGFTQQEGTE